MIICTKNRNILANEPLFEKNLNRIADEYTYGKKGCCDVKFFDEQRDSSGALLFPKDISPSGNHITKQFTFDQYQLMRTILPHHEDFIRKQICRESSYMRKRSRP